jgi:hypothetical protein
VYATIMVFLGQFTGINAVSILSTLGGLQPFRKAVNFDGKSLGIFLIVADHVLYGDLDESNRVR